MRITIRNALMLPSVQGEVRFAFLHQRRTGRQFSQPFTHGSFEVKPFILKQCICAMSQGLKFRLLGNQMSAASISSQAMPTPHSAVQQYWSTGVCLGTGSS